MNKNEFFAQFQSELSKSISDEVLINSEKKIIKKLLLSHAPDKTECDLLRSLVFDTAAEKINDTNYKAMVQWVEDLNKVILATQKSATINDRVYFSPGEACLNAILQHIKSSQQIIEICLFTISDNRIAEELVSKHNRGTAIKIITDNDKIYDKGSDIRMLQKAGIPVKVDVTDNHMHHKFALFDKTALITGSYNWTRSAERYNHENIIVTESKPLIQEFEREFKNLWEELIDYEQI